MRFRESVFVLAETRDCCARGIFRSDSRICILRDHIWFFFLLEGGTGSSSSLRDPRPYKDLPPSPRRGVPHTSPRRRRAKSRTPLNTILLLCLDQLNFTKDDFLTSLCERCVHGIPSRRQSAPQVFVERFTTVIFRGDVALPFHPLPPRTRKTSICHGRRTLPTQ